MRTRLALLIDSARRQLAAAPKQDKSDLQAKISVLQGELDLINARRNLLANMAQFASESDANGFGANALKAHIDAIAASIPSASTDSASSTSASTAASSAAPALVRYPVQLQHAAEIDERVSRELLNVISAHDRHAA